MEQAISKNLPLNGAGLSLEPVWDEDLVFGMVVACGKDVGSLEGLVEVAEDVVDGDDTLLGVRRSSHVFMFGIQNVSAMEVTK